MADFQESYPLKNLDILRSTTLLNRNEKPRPQLLAERDVVPNEPYIIRVAVIGSSRSGKTNFVRRLRSCSFENSSATGIGATFHKLVLTQDGKNLRLNIWDTSIQERFRSTLDLHLKRSLVVMVVYDISDRASFDSLPGWIQDQKEKTEGVAILFIVGTKLDLGTERKVNKEEAEVFARVNGGFYIEVSAKTNEKKIALREKLADSILAKYDFAAKLNMATLLAIKRNRKNLHFGEGSLDKRMFE